MLQNINGSNVTFDLNKKFIWRYIQLCFQSQI